MSIVTELGYRVRRPNPAQHLVQRVASTPWGAKALSLMLRHLDSLALRVTSGRRTAASVLAGLEVLDVTTTGRRSGQPRTSHLIAIPYAGTLALLGTNFGGAATPAWVHNLEADPRVSVAYRGSTVEAVARLATPEETEGVLAASEQVYAGYRKYQQRITHRRLRIFLFDPR